MADLPTDRAIREDELPPARPFGYQQQHSCRTCRHCFVMREYDASDQLYCTFGAPPRPPNGSVFMGETDLERLFPVGGNPDGSFTPEQEAEETKRFWLRSNTWDAWALPRRVTERSICSKHHEGEPDAMPEPGA